METQTEWNEQMQREVETVICQTPVKAVFSDRTDASYPYRKTVLRKILIGTREMYQAEQFTDKQVFHKNIEPEQLPETAAQLFPHKYRQLNVFGADWQADFRLSAKGKLLSHRSGRKPGAGDASGEVRKISIDGEPMMPHNRKKKYLLPEGTVVLPLVDLGIFTKEGKVVHSMYDKYRQINRFLEMVDDVVRDYPKRDGMRIVDFGCGKSYLTFILYYYLTEVKGLRVYMTGLDLKEDVIRKCNETAHKYGYERLHFETGDIGGYDSNEHTDMVISLHACDTATDYALYHAICQNAEIILSVPCCQHEVNGQMKTQNLSALTRYGIIKERTAALMTDAVRGCLLESCGYKTQLLEFIDLAHSPKNILIRAVKGNFTERRRREALEEAERLLAEFGAKPTLYRLLTEKNA